MFAAMVRLFHLSDGTEYSNFIKNVRKHAIPLLTLNFYICHALKQYMLCITPILYCTENSVVVLDSDLLATYIFHKTRQKIWYKENGHKKIATNAYELH